MDPDFIAYDAPTQLCVLLSIGLPQGIVLLLLLGALYAVSPIWMSPTATYSLIPMVTCAGTVIGFAASMDGFTAAGLFLLGAFAAGAVACHAQTT